MAPILPTPPPTSLPPSNSIPIPQPPSSLLTRSQKFIEENQRLILLGCAVAAASGAGYYLYTRSSGDGGPSTSSESSSSASARGKKAKRSKKKSAGGKSLKGEGTDGPLLEEIEKPADKTVGEALNSGEKSVEKEEGPSHLAGE